MAIWLMAVAVATGCFASSEARRVNDELIAFGSAAAVAAPFAAVIPLFMVNQKRFAVGVAASIACAAAGLVGAVYLLMWLAPQPLRSRVGYWELVRIQGLVWFWAKMTVRLCVPLGALVGGFVGSAGGLLLVLARRKPRLAAWITCGLVLTVAVGSAEDWAFGLLSDLVIRWRLGGGAWAVASISGKELAAALGASSGAILGVTAAATAMRLIRRPLASATSSNSATADAPDRPR